MLTATNIKAYAYCTAETTAVRIGVLNERGESHSESSGYFYVSHTLNGRRWTGGRKAAGTPRSRYANPVQLPPTPIGVGGRFYKMNRRFAMTTIQINTSTKCPPWAGYVHPSFVVVKVGNQFVTVHQVAK